MSAGKPYPFITPAGEMFLWETMKLLVQQKGAAEVEKVARLAVKMAREDFVRTTVRQLRARRPSNVIPFPGRGDAP
jgi:hypothetical protein